MLKLSNDGKTLLMVDKAFVGDLIIPEGVRDISAAAASSCTGITNIIFPKSLKYIRRYAFSGCKGVQRLHIPEGVEYIEGAAFKLDSPFVSSIILPKTVHTISGDSFDVPLYVDDENPYMYDWVGPKGECMVYKRNTKELLYMYDCEEENLDLPQGVETVGCSVFDGKKYKSVRLPSSVREIKDHAFANMRHLASITLNDGLEYIGNGAFIVGSFHEIALPSSLKYIGNCAFANCNGLSNIVIPMNVAYIGTSAFPCNVQVVVANDYFRAVDGAVYTSDMKHLVSYCGKNDVFIIPEGVVSIASHAFANTRIAKVVFPQSMRVIGDFAFSGCTSLHSVFFNHGLEIIGKKAFELANSLESIKIPSTVRYIGDGAFSNCFELNELFLLSKNIYDIQIADNFLGVTNFDFEVVVEKGMEYVVRNHDAFKDVTLFRTNVPTYN